eukprot:PITA_06664
MLLVGNDKEVIQDLKTQLSSKFVMKDLGATNYIFGMEIKRNWTKRKLYLNERKYVETILQRFNMQDSKSVKVPIPVGVRLYVEQCPKTQEEDEDMFCVPYASAVISLMYRMVCTRLNITHAVGVLSRFMSKPGKEHWTTVKRVFRYLHGTSDYGLCYQVSWMSTKQSIVALSTTEAEYMAATHASKEVFWLQRLCSSMGFVQEAIRIDCDSKSAIFLAKNPAYHSKKKHIDVQYHFVRDMIEDKKVLLVKVDTLKNTADALTKSVSFEKFSWCRETMGVVEIDK